MVTETERIAILLELKNEQFKKNARTAANEINRLERKFNPLQAAEAKLEKQQLRMNAALEAGTIDAANHAKAMDLVQREYDQTSARINGARSNVVAMNSAVAAQTGFMTRHRAIFQQGGYQVGDFAVQVQGGTSALTAFTQQGSQLLGVFGPWGAVMGAVLAVGAPLAGVLWNMGEATEDTKEKARTFTDRVGEADAALAAMSASADAASTGGLENLRKKYGELTDEVREMALALFEIDKREALEKVSGIITEVTGEIAKASQASAGAVSAALAASGTTAGKAEAAAYRLEVEKIAGIIENRKAAGQFVDPSEINNLRVMREELAALEGDFANIGSLVAEVKVSPDLLNDIAAAQSGLEAAKDAGEFGDMADQLGIIRNLLVQVGETVNQEVVDGVTNAEALAREMAARLDDGRNAAEGIAEVDIAGGIAPAVDEARKLAENFGIALSLARQLAANEAAANSAGRGRGGDPGKFGGSAKDIQKNVPASQLAYQPGGTAGVPLPQVRTTKTRGGGRSRSRSGGRVQAPLFDIAEDHLQKLERQIEMLGKSKSEIAALTVKHKLLDEAKKRGISVTSELTSQIEVQAGKVGELAAAYDQERDSLAKFESDIDSLTDALFDGEDGIKKFVKTYLLEMAKMQMSEGLKGFFGAIGGGGGFLGRIFGGIGANANGTPNWRGGLTSVNERGGEIMNLPQGTQIIPHDLSKRMIDQSRGGGAITLNVNSDPSVIVSIAENTTGMMIEQNNAAVEGGFNQRVKLVQRDPRMR